MQGWTGALAMGSRSHSAVINRNGRPRTLERRVGGPVVQSMSHPAAPPKPKTVNEISERISELIAEAIGETDNARRRGLLALADLWADIRRSRVSAGPAMHQLDGV